MIYHDDVIKWKHFPRYWLFVRGIHRSTVNSPHKGQWRGALMFSLICVWINGWVNNREAGDLRRHCAHYDVTVMWNTGLQPNKRTRTAWLMLADEKWQIHKNNCSNTQLTFDLDTRILLMGHICTHSTCRITGTVAIQRWIIHYICIVSNMNSEQ